MELNQITSNIYFLSAATNVGLIKQGSEVIIVDSGVDETVGAELLDCLAEYEFKLTAVINTHGHGDHCGANAYLAQNEEVTIYAPEQEKVIINNPYLEPYYLFSGAEPIPELKESNLLSPVHKVDKLLTKEGFQFGSLKIKPITLAGHSLNHTGLLVDNVLFAGDAFLDKEVLTKVKVPYHTDIKEQKKTLTSLQTSNYQAYLPSHGKLITNNLAEVVTANLQRIEEIEDFLLTKLTKWQRTEELIKKLAYQYGIRLQEEPQYFIMKTITMAYLSYLNRLEKIKLKCKDNYLVWKQS